MLKKYVSEIGAAAICSVMLFLTTACQSAPESSLVKNKNLDQLIQEAQNTDTERTDINDIIEEKHETYVTTIKNDDLKVTVNVNAKVDVPQTDKLSIFRVRQKQFSQELIDSVRHELLGDTKLYCGGVLSVKTKKIIEEEIAWWRNQMTGPDVTDAYRSECQGEIDSLQQAYESAPNSPDYSDYVSDGLLDTYDKMLSKYPENEYYEWGKMMNSKGNFVYEISDGTDGNYSMFYVQNNPEKSNKLVFRTNTVSYASHGGVMVGQTSLIPNTDSDDYPQNFLCNVEFYGEPDLRQCPGDVTETSLESAVKTADAFLTKIGIDGFQYYEGGQFSEVIRMDTASDGTAPDGTYYGTYYILRYYRNIDGAYLTQSSGAKNNPGNENGEGKLLWAGESIEFRINDNGIVGFDYNAPLDIVECVVENSSLKNFEEVKSTFEKMMPITKASQYFTKVYDVDRVRLSYSRISEADRYDTGLIVPVWDFLGNYESTEEKYTMLAGYGSLLAINAIDGSIIDPDLGY